VLLVTLILALALIAPAFTRGWWSTYQETEAGPLLAEVQRVLGITLPSSIVDARAAVFRHKWEDVVLRFDCDLDAAVKMLRNPDIHKNEAIEAEFALGRPGRRLAWWTTTSGRGVDMLFVTPREARETDPKGVCIAVRETAPGRALLLLRYRRSLRSPEI
jgi:hypothetical protein